MKMFALVVSFLFSAQVFASGAVFYSCVGNMPGEYTKSQSVVFKFVSAPSAGAGNTAFADIVSLSQGTVDPQNSHLNLDSKDCKLDVIPSKEMAGFKVLINGTCETKVVHNIVGLCLFDL